MSEYLKLKKSNCKNCYKCIRHCPVKSIRFSGNQAHIVSEDCILCGQCFVVCPQNAKEIVDESEKVRVLLGGEAPVIASVAPSFIAYFEGSSMLDMRAALKKLGFADAEETAIGATFVKREYDRMLESGTQEVIITSCCNSVNLLIGKYYPELLKYLAPIATPMRAHCADIKHRQPNAKTVFIGPCLSKKTEEDGEVIDAVLTFDELGSMLQSADIELTQTAEHTEESKARLFPTVGGVLGTMERKNNDYTYLTVDGAENCKAVLEDLSKGNINRYFIEMSMCAGSCIGGPVMEKYQHSPLRHYRSVVEYAGDKDFDVAQPSIDYLAENRGFIGREKAVYTDAEIEAVLRETGKLRPEDELNCGTCGYETCREKAVAVLQGKADVSMCLPYLMDKSERFTGHILNNTPNGILVVNDDMEVQQVNGAAMRMLNISSPGDVLGEQVVRILDPRPFLDARDGKQVRGRREYFAEYARYIDQTIVYDKASHMLIDIMRDVTEEESERREKEELGRQTAEIADKVVDKQMRIVQDIALLLGETAAETKIALTKLKESIPHDENE